jgi:hypothetical protein
VPSPRNLPSPYYRARYYHAQLQRFISEDPIGFRGGINRYAYVSNSSTNFLDPFGLDKKDPLDQAKDSARCPGEIQSELASALLNVSTLGLPRTAAELSGHVVTVGYDGNLAATFGTFGVSVHAGDALAFDPHGNIALISTTGTGGGFGGDVGIVGQVGYLRATSVLDLEPESMTANTTVTLGDGLQGSVGVDTEGNVTLGIGVGEGVVTSGTIDNSRVRIIACLP